MVMTANYIKIWQGIRNHSSHARVTILYCYIVIYNRLWRHKNISNHILDVWKCFLSWCMGTFRVRNVIVYTMVTNQYQLKWDLWHLPQLPRKQSTSGVHLNVPTSLHLIKIHRSPDPVVLVPLKHKSDIKPSAGSGIDIRIGLGSLG